MYFSQQSRKYVKDTIIGTLQLFKGFTEFITRETEFVFETNTHCYSLLLQYGILEKLVTSIYSYLYVVDSIILEFDRICTVYISHDIVAI